LQRAQSANCIGKCHFGVDVTQADLGQMARTAELAIHRALEATTPLPSASASLGPAPNTTSDGASASNTSTNVNGGGQSASADSSDAKPRYVSLKLPAKERERLAAAFTAAQVRPPPVAAALLLLRYAWCAMSPCPGEVAALLQGEHPCKRLALTFGSIPTIAQQLNRISSTLPLPQMLTLLL
jgi:hypothetical protein